MFVRRLAGRAGFALLAAAALAMTAVAVVASEILRLQACPLCIFQRLLYLLIALVALLGALFPAAKLFWALLIGSLAAGGVATAAYQSWLQFAAEGSMGCGFGEPTLIERLVDWLGTISPMLFMATGFCASKEWVVFGLSMANWSCLGFLAFLAAAVALLLDSRPESTRAGA